MTTFEITITIIAVLGVLMISVSACFVIELLRQIKRWQESIWNELRSIWVNVADTAEYTHNHIAPDLELVSRCISESAQYLNNMNVVLDKMHRNLCVEIADKMVDRAYPPTYVTPCYAPNGICTNPQMDCINCPKRGTGGTWSTNLNKND